ncbi:MBL fold metallo-hydrolase [Ruminococcaceae bacterium OttesenSCG-928-L11]|nr:MBL fold metallo-hydrolase [Ruminococcaceae bacterium OttesenSCG-928-L11]
MLKLTILPLNAGAMCPVIVDDGTEMLLIDCGMAGTYDTLRQTADLKEVDFSRLSKIIITHHDHDHTGNLAAIRADFPHVEIIASAIEKEYIEGARKSIRLEQAEEAIQSAPPEKQGELQKRIDMLRQIQPVAVDTAVIGGEVLGWCGGVEIIATPGHMPGHISVHIPELQTLVTGDAMNMRDGSLQMANPAFTLDMDEAARSIEKCMALDLVQVICYHGGVFTGNVRQALSAVVTGYRAGR